MSLSEKGTRTLHRSTRKVVARLTDTLSCYTEAAAAKAAKGSTEILALLSVSCAKFFISPYHSMQQIVAQSFADQPARFRRQIYTHSFLLHRSSNKRLLKATPRLLRRVSRASHSSRPVLQISHFPRISARQSTK